MELKDLDKEYKRLKQRMYWHKRMDKIKADPEKYEEFKRKDRIRIKRYRDLKKMNKKEANMPKTIEELKKEIKRLKSKEASRKSYLKLKADKERYAKRLAYVRERYFKKKAEKAVVKAAEEVVNQPVPDINEPHWNWPPFATADRIVSQEKVIGIANNAADKNIVVGEGQTGTINEEGNIENVNLYNASADNTEPEDEDVSKAYENFINCIKAYVPNILHTFEIYKAFGNYVKAYKKFLDTKKQYLLDKITDLFNKE